MSAKISSLIDRLASRDSSLTDLVIAAAATDDDAENDDDDLDIYPLLSQHLSNNATIRSISITERGPCDDDGIPDFVKVLPSVSSLQSLSLIGVGLSQEDVNAIGQSLPQISNMKVLELSRNGIDDSGAALLCSSIKKCPELHHLYLNGNSISDDGARAIAEILPDLSQLESFGLGNLIGKEGSKDICGALASVTRLHTLDLGGNRKNGADLANSIASAMPSISSSLKRLKLENAGIGPRGTKALLTALAQNKVGLKELDISGCRVGFFGTKAIGSIGLPPCLEILNISNNSIGDDGAWQLTSAVGILNHLTSLNVSANQFGDDAAAEVARMLPSLKNLASLDLSRNKGIGDSGAEVIAEALSSTPRLAELLFASNTIGNAGATALGQALENNSCNIIRLDLNNNIIGDDGAVELAAGIKTNTSLTYLSLKSNDIGDEGAGEFVEHLDTNKTIISLDLADNSVSSSRTMLLDMLLKHRKPAKAIAAPSASAVPMTPNKMPVDEYDLTSPTTARTPVGTDIATDEINEEDIQKSRELIQDVISNASPVAKLKPQFAVFCTNNFNVRNLLNYGSYGDLFEGQDEECKRRYAIRRLVLADSGVLKDMRARVLADLASLKQIGKPNILPLLAYSTEDRDESHEIYTFMYDLGSRNSLKEVIADEDKRKLMPWPKRIKILKGVVAAVAFLHSGDKEKKIRPSYHGDVKSSNIFVDDELNACLIDCGISRLAATDRTLFQRGDVFFGTRGYRCPRYERGFKFTTASDIFSLGLVIAEVIGGKLQNDVDESTGKVHDYYYQHLLEKKITLDPLAGPISKEAAGALCRLSLVCMNSEPALRPSSATLSKMLEHFVSGADDKVDET